MWRIYSSEEDGRDPHISVNRPSGVTPLRRGQLKIARIEGRCATTEGRTDMSANSCFWAPMLGGGDGAADDAYSFSGPFPRP